MCYGLCIALAGKTTSTDEQPLSHTLSPYHQMRVFPNTNLRYTISWKNFGDSSLLVPTVTYAGITLVWGCIANTGHIPSIGPSAVPSPQARYQEPRRKEGEPVHYGSGVASLECILITRMC